MRDEETRARKQARKEMVVAIGQRLKEHYDTAQPLPERLSELLKKIERSTSNSEFQRT